MRCLYCHTEEMPPEELVEHLQDCHTGTFGRQELPKITEVSESEKFFAKASILLDHIENGEVELMPRGEHDGGEWFPFGGYRVIITPKEVE